MPFWSDSATFSAAWRQIEQRRKSASPSFHSLVALSSVRGVEAIVKFATAAPDGVNRSSGSPVRFPTTVMTVSPALWVSLVEEVRVLRSVSVGTEDLGAKHRLVQRELAVELLDSRGLGLQLHDG